MTIIKKEGEGEGREGRRKKKKEKITSVGEDVEKLEPCTLLVGIQYGAATLGNTLVGPQEISIELPYDPEILLHVYMPNRIDRRDSNRYLF